jgi:hypothetical protein
MLKSLLLMQRINHVMLVACMKIISQVLGDALGSWSNKENNKVTVLRLVDL